MNYAERVLKEVKVQKKFPTSDKDRGLYHSATVAKSPEWIYEFCSDENVMDRVMQDLPEGVSNFLELRIDTHRKTEKDHYEFNWKSKEGHKFSATLFLSIQPDLKGRGSILTAEGHIANMSSEDEPSALILVFLKRLKALLETGVIASTKGQSSGREEFKQLH